MQEMENYRDEVIVIFAGYPEKMKEFLEQNEGLASRIAFHLNFPDYSPVELTQILDLMLEKSEYRMDERTREKCFSICADACREENYGNGRFVRNLLDHAIICLLYTSMDIRGLMMHEWKSWQRQLKKLEEQILFYLPTGKR